MQKVTKRRKITAFLALFLGGIGIHRFYLGNYILGFVYLFFCWTYIPLIISVIESTVFFSMTDKSFDEKYSFKNKRGLQSKYKGISLLDSTNVNTLDQEYDEIDINVSVTYDNIYSYYGEFNSSSGEKFNTEQERTIAYPENFWDGINKAYKEITIKLEGVKQYGDLEGMKQFEKDIHTFFLDRVLKVALDQSLIDHIEADEEPPVFDREINNYYQYFGKILSESEMKEAKRLFYLEQKFYKKNTKRQIYDMYCKSLRRVGNFYKKYNEWEAALNIFFQIKNFGFEGIMDGKSIIKCQKEIDILHQKLLNK